MAIGSARDAARAAVILAVLHAGSATGAQEAAESVPDTVVVPVVVRVHADSLLMGQPFRVDAELVHPGLEAIEMITPLAELGPIEVTGIERALDRGDTAHVVIDAAAFAVGRHRVAPLRFAARAAGDLCVAVSESLTVTVLSTVPADAESLLPIREAVPIRPPARRWPWIVAAAAALALAALITAWWRRRGRAPILPATPPAPAHERALAALSRLAASDLARMGPWKAFYTELTDILRHYVAERYGVDAPDLTTSETLAALRQAQAPDQAVLSLRGVLHEGDAVKFAKAVPATDVPSRDLAAARAFVTLTTATVTSVRSSPPAGPSADGHAPRPWAEQGRRP